MVSKAINLGLRGLEFLWTLLIMALVGNFIALAQNGNTSVINYEMFLAVFTMLCIFFLIPATIKDNIVPPVVMVGIDVLLTILWFCGAVAMAAILHVHSCSNQDYLNTNTIIKNGGHSEGQRCREAQAVTAFTWFGFAAFAASCVLSGLQSRGGAPSGIRRSGLRK